MDVMKKREVTTTDRATPTVPGLVGEGPRGAAEQGPRRRSKIPFVIGLIVLVVLLLGAFMVWRAAARTNKVALASLPVPVTAVPASATTFQPTRTYVGTLRPWVEANVGPQFISAYVDTVLVRPGAVVKRGEVLATLDCRFASKAAQAIASQARAIEARQTALAHEAERTQQLVSGGFVSPNEAEQKLARSAAEAAQLEAEKANLAKSTLSVSDCILRSPFDGEVADRYFDPGAFVRPGSAIVTVVDRNIVRMTADVPENDFSIVTPGNPSRVHVLSTGRDIDMAITRRAPAADSATRTIHVEIDIPDPKRHIPVNTTGEVFVKVGKPVPATDIPMYAASTTGEKATLFTVDGDVARAATLPVLGEVNGRLFFAPDVLRPGTLVVLEGRALLTNGQKVAAKRVEPPPVNGSAATVVAEPAEPKPASKVNQ